LSLNNKYDYIVVGQGLAGTLLTHELIDHGKKVLVIDTKLKASASRVAAGLINPVSMKRCIPAFPDYYLKEALNRYIELGKKLNFNFLNLKSLLRLFDSDETKALWEEKVSDKGMDIYIKEFINKNNFTFLNDYFSSAIIEPAGFLDVISFLDYSRIYFAKKGEFLDEKFDFSLFNDSEISYKDFKADKIIFCEGFRLTENPFFNYLPLAPTKGEVMTIKIPSKKYFDKIISKDVYILPLGNYLYTVGATYNREDISDSLTDEGQSFLKERIDDILNLEYEIINSVAGVRPTVRDRKPLIGYHPENNRIGVFNGLGARGVLVGPYLSNQFVCSSLQTINRFN
tara:strand:+ start:243 stop:1268 length:1026 start_codon:yes stop_codon:yes gene_type:complete